MGARRGRRGGAALLVVVVVLGVLAFGARTLWRAAQSVVQPAGCDFGSYSLDLDQAQIASVIVGVVLKRDLPERAAVLTIGAALQESKLRNIPAGQGDRDSVGKRCLIGANAGIGISLGDDCVVAAGTYVTAGSKVVLPDGTVRKAAEFSGQSGLQFWQNSVTGALEVRQRSGAPIALNTDLHAN